MIKTRIYYIDDYGELHSSEQGALEANKKAKLNRCFNGTLNPQTIDIIFRHFDAIKRIMEA